MSGTGAAVAHADAGEGAAEIGPAACDQHARLRELGDRGRGADDDVRGLAARERRRTWPIVPNVNATCAPVSRASRAAKSVTAYFTAPARPWPRPRPAPRRDALAEGQPRFAYLAVPVAVQGGGLELSARGDRAGAQVRRDRGRQVHLV